MNSDDEELLAVQAEPEEVLEKGGYDGCVAGGDWNYDARRTSGFARSMASFFERVGLVSVWEKFPIDFTYMHTDQFQIWPPDGATFVINASGII